jgi:hypothetical protein
MKKHNSTRSSIRSVALSAVLALGTVSSSFAANVSISGISQERNQDIINFFQSSFLDVNISFGDYSDPANIPVGTDIFVVGRIVSSGAYGNVANSATFNALGIPVISLTSYVTRPDGDRWGWHSAGVANGGSVVGDETTVTAAGASIFGSAGPADWWTVTDAGSAFNAAGTGTVGTGDILATIGGNILAAGWEAGDTSAGGVIFTANRLLFNLPDSDPNTGNGVVPDTAAGRQALISAITAFTPLVVIPEPATSALVLGGLAMLVAMRRRN